MCVMLHLSSLGCSMVSSGLCYVTCDLNFLARCSNSSSTYKSLTGTPVEILVELAVSVLVLQLGWDSECYLDLMHFPYSVLLIHKMLCRRVLTSNVNQYSKPLFPLTSSPNKTAELYVGMKKWLKPLFCGEKEIPCFHP